MAFWGWFKIKFQELKEKPGVSHTQKEEAKAKRGLRITFSMKNKSAIR